MVYFVLILCVENRSNDVVQLRSNKHNLCNSDHITTSCALHCTGYRVFLKQRRKLSLKIEMIINFIYNMAPSNL